MPIHSNLAFRPKFHHCSICNEAVELETAKIDESGKPVHEECYVRKVCIHTTATEPAPIQENLSHKRKTIRQEVIEFLDLQAARPISRFCPFCGSQLECREATVCHEDRSWKLHLTNCVKCNPISRDFVV